MSTAYTGNPANATPLAALSITIPADGDPASAASVNSPGPFEPLTDLISFLNTKAFQPDQIPANYVGVTIPTSHPTYNTFTYYYVGGIKGTGTQLPVRFYYRSDGALCITVNAYASPGLNCWVADQTAPYGGGNAYASLTSIGSTINTGDQGAASPGFPDLSFQSVADVTTKSYNGAHSWSDNVGANGWDNLGSFSAAFGTLGAISQFNGNVVVANGLVLPSALLSATGSSFTLPSSSNSKQGGYLLIVKDTAGTAGTTPIVVHAYSGGSIDGASTATINTAYGSLRLYKNGTSGNNWFTF